MGYYDNYLEHHGILGQKWGVRRFQNKDGTLTTTGKNRYGDGPVKKHIQSIKNEKANRAKADDYREGKSGLTDKQKKYLKIGAAVAATALASYGGYKLYQSNKQTSVTSATNKIASEASKLAKSVIAEGPKSFSTSTQNSTKTKEAMTAQKLQAAKATYDTGKKAVNSVTQIVGQQKFSQASKANDDLVNDLLKKNAQLLNGF